jgi:hypothetical protein
MPLDCGHCECLSLIEIPEEILKAPIKFGLEAQGHIPTITWMLSEGATWDTISAKIGWDRTTARTHYEKLVGEESTRSLRAVLAESIELLRIIYNKHSPRINICDENMMASAFLRGNNLLASKTAFDFDYSTASRNDSSRSSK